MDSAMSKVNRLIERHKPCFPSSVRGVGQAISAVRQLIERENIAPRVICAVANPESSISFEDVRRVIHADGTAVRDLRSAEPIYTQEGAKLRLRLVMGIVGLQDSGGLKPFVTVDGLVGAVYQYWQFRLMQSMRHTCDVALEYIGALADKPDDVNLIVGELADAVAKYMLIQTGQLPSWAPDPDPVSFQRETKG